MEALVLLAVCRSAQHLARMTELKRLTMKRSGILGAMLPMLLVLLLGACHPRNTSNAGPDEAIARETPDAVDADALVAEANRLLSAHPGRYLYQIALQGNEIVVRWWSYCERAPCPSESLEGTARAQAALVAPEVPTTISGYPPESVVFKLNCTDDDVCWRVEAGAEAEPASTVEVGFGPGMVDEIPRDADRLTEIWAVLVSGEQP